MYYQDEYVVEVFRDYGDLRTIQSFFLKDKEGQGFRKIIVEPIGDRITIGKAKHKNLDRMYRDTIIVQHKLYCELLKYIDVFNIRRLEVQKQEQFEYLKEIFENGHKHLNLFAATNSMLKEKVKKAKGFENYIARNRDDPYCRALKKYAIDGNLEFLEKGCYQGEFPYFRAKDIKNLYFRGEKGRKTEIVRKIRIIK